MSNDGAGGAAKLRGRHRHAAAGKTISIDKLVAWLGISLDEFPAWACAHLESELASINELARMFRDNEEPAALVRPIDDRVAKLKRLIVDWAKRRERRGGAILILDCGNSTRAANIKQPDAM